MNAKKGTILRCLPNSWAATKTNLNDFIGGRIVAVNGKPVKTYKERWRTISNLKIGQNATFTIEKNKVSSGIKLGEPVGTGTFFIQIKIQI